MQIDVDVIVLMLVNVDRGTHLRWPDAMRSLRKRSSSHCRDSCDIHRLPFLLTLLFVALTLKPFAAAVCAFV